LYTSSQSVKMLNLNHCYITAFFKQRKHHNANKSKELQEAHNSLHKNNSKVVTKSDKSNSVVLLNQTNYVSKTEDILSNASKFSE